MACQLNVPESVQQGHSATSISRHMLKTIGHAQADCYKSTPSFCQIPLDGIFVAFTLKMNYISQASGEIEEIHLLIKENQQKPKHSTTRVEQKTFINFLTSLFHRFTKEFSEIPAQPINNDMSYDNLCLLTKTQRIATFTFRLSICIL